MTVVFAMSLGRNPGLKVRELHQVGITGKGIGIGIIDTALLVDHVEYGLQAKNLSIGRNGGAWKLLDVPSPGAVNAAPAVRPDHAPAIHQAVDRAMGPATAMSAADRVPGIPGIWPWAGTIP